MNAHLMTRILLATDFSDCALRAQEYATSLAMTWDAGMDVLHVLESPASVSRNAAGISSLEQSHQDAALQLDEVQKQIVRNGVAATVHQVKGVPSEQINLVAKECGVDLVVVGTHGQTCLEHVLLGSTADRVTKTAPCPVLAVRRVRERSIRHPMAAQSPVSIQHILAPVDFSSPSLASLVYAIQFAKRLGAKLTLMHVLEPVYHDLELGLGQIEQEPAKRVQWEAHLAELATLVRSFGLLANSVVCGGIASDSILVCALRRQCDLIVMGTHGQRGLSRPRFGSVAGAVLRQATCPVLTVRSPKSSPGHHRVTLETAIDNGRRGASIMDPRDIYITEFDFARLKELLQVGISLKERDRDHLESLQNELDRAHIVDSIAIPHNVVTMNSRVCLKEMETGEENIYTLVFPSDADIEQNKISILAPIGTAILGYRTGDRVDWLVPAGKRKVRIQEVLYQPEAAGHYAL